MELSIFKQLTSSEVLIEHILSKGMSRSGERQQITINKIINGKEEQVNAIIDFFTRIESDESVEVEWHRYWKGFFNDSTKMIKTVESAYGIVIVQLGAIVYSISLGRGHFYANSFADLDFGFDIAEIIHDENSIDVKSAKFFQQAKNKSLTQYNKNSYVTTEIGESHELLISKIRVHEKYQGFLLNAYAGRIKFGSAVKIETSEYNPREVIDIVFELHFIYLNEEKSGTLPRMNLLKTNEDNKPMIADLNRKLLQAIINNDMSVSLTYFLEDNGDIFIEPAREDELELVCSKAYSLNLYAIECISNLIKEINCEDITKVSIRTKSQKQNSIKLIRLLDFTTIYRDKTYCLYKGKWASFNDSYIEFINREIIKVNQIAKYNEDYCLTDLTLEKGRTIQNTDTQQYDNVTYTEYPFNIYLHDRLGFKLLDRKSWQELYKSVEFADLYDDVEKSLIHVKIGETPDIRYCITQSLHSAEIYNSQRNVLAIYGIQEVKKIVMVFVLNTSNMIQDDGVIDFLKNKSIYFHIEVIEWLTKIRSMGFTAEIIVARDLRK